MTGKRVLYLDPKIVVNLYEKFGGITPVATALQVGPGRVTKILKEQGVALKRNNKIRK